MAVPSERQPGIGQPPSLWEATAELASAMQQVVSDRLDLLRHELAYDATQFAVGIGLVVSAALVAALGWVGLACAAVVVLDRFMGLDAAFAIVGGLHVAVGVALATLAMRRFRNATEAAADAPPLREVGRG